VAVILAYAGRAVSLPEGWPGPYGVLVTIFPVAIAFLLSLLIIERLPGNLYGWLWLWLAFAFGTVVPLARSYAVVALLVAPDALPFGWPALMLSDYAWLCGFAMVPLILLLFPTGKVPAPRWRYLIYLVAVALIVGLLTGWSNAGQGLGEIQRPTMIEGPARRVTEMVLGIAAIVLYVAVLLGASSLIFRYAQATTHVRQQIKWFTYGAIVFCLGLVSDFLYTAPGNWEAVKESLMFSILPISVGIAILRYHLWDIDVIIRKTLVYAALTAGLAAIYFGSIVLLQTLVGQSTSQQSPIVIVISTLLIAALFSPLRRRLQNTVDRRFYRRKYDAQQVLARFALAARDETELEVLTAALRRAVMESVHPRHISFWISPEESFSTAPLKETNTPGPPS
jgi:hypothetical protein